MKELYLGISIILGVILLTMLGEVLTSILSFMVFGIIGLFFMSAVINYRESKETLKQAKRESIYE